MHDRHGSRTWSASFLTASVLAYVLGVGVLGAALGLVVAALALLAAATGFCAGCETYKLAYALTGRPFVACPLPPRPRATSDQR